jgi:hypothetical protein
MLDLLVAIAAIVREDVESWRGHDLFDEIVEDREIVLRQGVIGTGNPACGNCPSCAGYDVADN